MPEASLEEVVQHTIGGPLLILEHGTGYPDEEAITVGRAEGGAYLLGHHLGDSVAILLPDVVEQTHGVVLHHHVVRGESLGRFIDPTLDYLAATLETEMLHGQVEDSTVQLVEIIPEITLFRKEAKIYSGDTKPNNDQQY